MSNSVNRSDSIISFNEGTETVAECLNDGSLQKFAIRFDFLASPWLLCLLAVSAGAVAVAWWQTDPSTGSSLAKVFCGLVGISLPTLLISYQKYKVLVRNASSNEQGNKLREIEFHQKEEHHTQNILGNQQRKEQHALVTTFCE